ncbi:hypothetical protein E2C01_060644 [Portunus trituberculatus]|uniref:Uncharacterized protein n=1 Tax=Portunus trituberculatus TaxID=210409 RepID=A0A5B7H9A2_PORTR|nr:hypothetical protein [Portunus trituberculatus]
MNSPRHMKPRYCPEVGFTRPHSTQAEVLSELPDFWKSVEEHITVCYVIFWKDNGYVRSEFHGQMNITQIITVVRMETMEFECSIKPYYDGIDEDGESCCEYDNYDDKGVHSGDSNIRTTGIDGDSSYSNIIPVIDIVFATSTTTTIKTTTTTAAATSTLTIMIINVFILTQYAGKSFATNTHARGRASFVPQDVNEAGVASVMEMVTSKCSPP